MGRIAKLLSFVRVIRNSVKLSDVKVDTGGNIPTTGEHFAPPGDDSFPLPTDYVFMGGNSRTGGESALGYVDPINDPVAQEGDKRIYARDPATGLAVVEWWLKSDGSGVMSNASGSIALQASGNVVINGVTITPAGVITGVVSLEVNGVEVDQHTHAQGNDSDGDTQVDTGPMI